MRSAPAARAAGAPLILEAQVLTAQSFWDGGHRHLFTRHRLRVFSLLKGSVADTAGLVVVTEGGQLGLDQQVLTNTLRLAPGQQGVLFLTPAPWPGLDLAGPTYAAYGSTQGFVAYDLAHATAADPVRAYPAIDAAFYQSLDPQGARVRHTLQPNPALAAAQRHQLAAAKGTAVATISGIQPAQLTAGTGAVLTIRGSGFGEARGAGFVEFANADDGGRTFEQPLAADYLAWADGVIQVRVPSTGVGGHPAGSGLVRVTPDGGTVGASPQLLTVVYALSNVKSTDAVPTVQRPNHVATNGLGGLTFRLAPNFGDNAAAGAAWQRALANWRCQTGMNWALGDAAPSNDIASDGRSTVAFDLASAALPAGVLGRTTSYYQGCFAADRSVVFYVGEVDMQFSTAAAFQFGPALAVGLAIDFETVAVHELGHAQQLSHLIRPGAIMHYAVARGQNSRRLAPESDVAGGRQVLRTRSFRTAAAAGRRCCRPRSRPSAPPWKPAGPRAALDHPGRVLPRRLRGGAQRRPRHRRGHRRLAARGHRGAGGPRRHLSGNRRPARHPPRVLPPGPAAPRRHPRLRRAPARGPRRRPGSRPVPEPRHRHPAQPPVPGRGQRYGPHLQHLRRVGPPLPASRRRRAARPQRADV
ncbi:hypothetical protein BEN49_04575 [Hymenobacter coccineus]|uniref:Peptidase M10 metallopeptidase domain-containing protein n=1 Tax=Hymenobacter coccineus TaxID=1908235 RepID=A0A1G1TL99_9BACT|nr:hypothetical protein BEN49_04575 [Hymenobacter coccineus]